MPETGPMLQPSTQPRPEILPSEEQLGRSPDQQFPRSGTKDRLLPVSQRISFQNAYRHLPRLNPLIAVICCHFALVITCTPVGAGQAMTSQRGDAIKVRPGILVELFTSEGCSSCPPADELLRKLDSQQTANGSQLVVLGEHVDYWDGTGWHDRFSSRDYTDRQEEYARRLGTSGPYTPQMVVDGRREFVGNSAPLLQAALTESASQSKASLQISVEQLDGAELLVKVDAGALPSGGKHADLYIAIADNTDETQIGGGENSGRRLVHAAVLRNLQKVGKLGPEGGQKEIKLRIPKSENPQNVRLVAFLQEANNGAVLGAAVKILNQQLAIR
jgi:hypothetical protein